MKDKRPDKSPDARGTAGRDGTAEAPGFVGEDSAEITADPLSLDTMDEFLLGTVDVSLGSQELEFTDTDTMTSRDLEARGQAKPALRSAQAVVVSDSKGPRPLVRIPTSPAESGVSQIGPGVAEDMERDEGRWGQDMETMPIPPEELERFRRQKK